MSDLKKISLKKFWMDLKTNSLDEKWIQFFIPNKDAMYVISLSGGADSTLLLYIYNEFYKKKYINELIAFHFNHNIREDSRKDEEFVVHLCQNFDIPLYIDSKPIKKIHKKFKGNLEEISRIYRYRSLYKFICKIPEKESVILTAHHADDYLETVLLKILRGSTFRNSYFFPNRRIPLKIGKEIKILNVCSPLLIFNKSEILEFLKENQIQFILDKTNLDLNYKRNYIRTKIVEELKKINLDSALLWQKMHLKNNFFILSHSRSDKVYDYIFLKISLLHQLPLPDLKVFLDQITKSLGISPFSSRFLKEFLHQSKNEKIYLENRECILETVRDTLWIIKKNSTIREFPVVYTVYPPHKEQKTYVKWNHQTRIYNLNLDEIILYREVEQNKKTREELNEILREFNFPLSIRSHIPYLKKNHSLSKIYLSFLEGFWDYSI